MFAGHMGAGLALGSAARDINVGVFVAAALLPVALAVESTLVLVGVYVFTFGFRSRGYRPIALGILTAVVMIFTAIGMTVAPAPPSPIAMAASSLATLAGLYALALWLGRNPAPCAS